MPYCTNESFPSTASVSVANKLRFYNPFNMPHRVLFIHSLSPCLGMRVKTWHKINTHTHTYTNNNNNIYSCYRVVKFHEEQGLGSRTTSVINTERGVCACLRVRVCVFSASLHIDRARRAHENVCYQNSLPRLLLYRTTKIGWSARAITRCVCLCEYTGVVWTTGTIVFTSATRDKTR